MIQVNVTGLNGHIINLRIRNTNVDNIKRRIYNHFKAQSINIDVDADGKINKYHMKYQILLLNTELLHDDVVKDGDVITLLLDNTAIQHDVRKLEQSAISSVVIDGALTKHQREQCKYLKREFY